MGTSAASSGSLLSGVPTRVSGSKHLTSPAGHRPLGSPVRSARPATEEMAADRQGSPPAPRTDVAMASARRNHEAELTSHTSLQVWKPASRHQGRQYFTHTGEVVLSSVRRRPQLRAPCPPCAPLMPIFARTLTPATCAPEDTESSALLQRGQREGLPGLTQRVCTHESSGEEDPCSGLSRCGDGAHSSSEGQAGAVEGSSSLTSTASLVAAITGASRNFCRSWDALRTEAST